MRLFRRKHQESKSSQSKNPKAVAFMELKNYISNLLSSDSYISQSQYQKKLKDNEEIIQFFNGLEESDILNDFCKKQSLKIKEVQQFSADIKIIDDKVKEHNENFIKEKLVNEKQYLDDILKDVDPVISLDDDQRRVVLTDEDYCLVIAGAGAGKTTTVAAKVKYLVKKKI